MKTIVLGGFLGSGKTTLLLQLVPFLRSHAAAVEYPVVVLENEISTTDVDSQLLRDQGLNVQTLAAGCICCTSRASLADSLREIRRRYEPAYLVIEATGMAYPDAIADVLRQNGETDITILALADARRWSRVSRAMPKFLESQLAQASLVFLNKTDLVSAEEARAVQRELEQAAPQASIFPICARAPIADAYFSSLL